MTNIFKTIGFAFAMIVATAGCRKTLDITNGEIPPQYLDQAQQLGGVYQGQMNNEPGTLTLAFDGNRPRIRFSNANGNDLLNNHCNSKVGPLVKVIASGTPDNLHISSAVFKFDPGSCPSNFANQVLILQFNPQDTTMELKLSLTVGTEQGEVCGWWNYGYAEGGTGVGSGYPIYYGPDDGFDGSVDTASYACRTGLIYKNIYGKFLRH